MGRTALGSALRSARFIAAARKIVVLLQRKRFGINDGSPGADHYVRSHRQRASSSSTSACCWVQHAVGGQGGVTQDAAAASFGCECFAEESL
jgi:hypothetical protein